MPGLYFIGEVVDVTGWLGGYNFQWAWASAQPAPAWQRHAGYNVGLTLASPQTAIPAIFPVEEPGPGPDLPQAKFNQTDFYMTTIRVKENEPFDVALRRFKRTIEKLGLLTDLRAREFYEKPTAERKRKKAAAVKRHYKRVRSMQLPKKLY